MAGAGPLALRVLPAAIVSDAFVMVSVAEPSVAIRQIRERKTGIAVLASLRRLAFLFLSLILYR